MEFLKNEEKPVVEGCPFEHNEEKLGKEQDVIYREMRNKKTKKPLFYMQCARCGCCGPVGDSINEAAQKWNSRLVKVYPRDEFEKIKSEMQNNQ